MVWMQSYHNFLISSSHLHLYICFKVSKICFESWLFNWNVWKGLLPRDEVVLKSYYRVRIIHSMPSTSGNGKSASWWRVESIMALARIKVRDSLPKSWLVTSPSSHPLHLANAAASCFTCAVAPEWNPPNVSTANGRRTIPSWWQASAVSLTFLWQAFEL